jgi:hypothetical protein
MGSRIEHEESICFSMEKVRREMEEKQGSEPAYELARSGRGVSD